LKGVLDFISSIFSPVADLVDAVHTSDEEKLTLKNTFETIKNTMAAKYLDLESQLLTAKASIINAESNGDSWIQRSWRPITMLTFLALVVCDSFGWLANPLAPQAWELLKIGLGGYVIGRSAEKVAPQLIDAIKTTRK
jgi:hypothetical protein